MMVTRGNRLGDRYRLLERRGRGGMAEVFTAFDEVLERRVAVKLLSGRLADDPAAVGRFRREARTAARLAHASVVPVFDAATDGDVPFMVMELLEGPTLAERLRDEGRLPVGEALRIAATICEGLEVAHRLGLVHRDVKPSNVLFTTEGHPKVTDFGIAGAAEVSSGEVVHGSVPYVAPEQIRGAPADPRSDVYGLGCVLFEMLVGRPPFSGATSAAVLSQHLHRPAPTPSHLVPEVPRGVDEIVLTALATEPERRYPDVSALREDLERVASGQPPLHAATEATTPLLPGAPTVPVGPEPGRRRGRSAWWVAAAAIVAALLASVALTGSGGPQPEASGPATAPPSTPGGEAESPSGEADPGPRPEAGAVEGLEELLTGLLAERRAEWEQRRAEQLEQLRAELDDLAGWND